MKLCSKKTGNQFNKCLPFFIVGAILIIVGIPMMLAGIIGVSGYSDIIGYIGGATVFFGLVFLFVWFVVIIPNLEKMKLPNNDDPENQRSKKNLTKTSIKKDISSYSKWPLINVLKSSSIQKASSTSVTSKVTSREQVETPAKKLMSTSSTQVLDSNNKNNNNNYSANINNNVFLVHDEDTSRSKNGVKIKKNKVEIATISAVYTCSTCAKNCSA